MRPSLHFLKATQPSLEMRREHRTPALAPHVPLRMLSLNNPHGRREGAGWAGEPSKRKSAKCVSGFSLPALILFAKRSI